MATASRARRDSGEKPPKMTRLDIRAGDTVEVLAGKDRGKRGVVERTVPSLGKIVVTGVNILKRHQRAGVRKGSTTAIQGGVVDFPAPIAYSNVMLVCNRCERKTRIRKEVLPEGKSVILCTRCGEIHERVKTT
ncbi:MAG: 50S ribosomal protein L24 [Candidatus Dormibacteria bacterium]